MFRRHTGDHKLGRRCNDNTGKDVDSTTAAISTLGELKSPEPRESHQAPRSIEQMKERRITLGTATPPHEQNIPPLWLSTQAHEPASTSTLSINEPSSTSSSLPEHTRKHNVEPPHYSPKHSVPSPAFSAESLEPLLAQPNAPSRRHDRRTRSEESDGRRGKQAMMAWNVERSGEADRICAEDAGIGDRRVQEKKIKGWRRWIRRVGKMIVQLGRDGRTCDGRSVKRAGRRGLDGYGIL